MGDRSPEIAALVLAAGKGTRMKSGLVKVLHPIAGRPMLHFPLAATEALDPARVVVVVGRDADKVRSAFAGRATFVTQEEQKGTGHAVLQARDALRDFRGDVLILYGDTPLLRGETLRRMAELRRDTGAALVLLTGAVDVRGIVIRDAAGRVERIVEAPDATPQQLEIEERNTGVYLLDGELLWKMLAQVGDENEQGEVYLTDIVELSVRDGLGVEALRMEDDEEALGVDDRQQLAQAGAVIRRRKAEQLQQGGVTIVDPAATYIDVDVQIGMDTVVEPGCVIQGPTRIGERVHLKPGCMLESCEVGDDGVLGPNAHLRPDSVLGRGVRIGNYVEVKNSVLGDGVKADHLSYIGDADVGDGAAFGCGAITVNYDWKGKHRTSVGAGATVGCNVNLIAPVTIGRNSAVAAGSTITKEVPEDALAVARGRQAHVPDWVARREGRAPAPVEARAKTSKKRSSVKKKTSKKKTAKKKPAKKKAVKKKSGRTAARKRKKTVRRARR